MYDFWYAMGTAVVEPGILGPLQAVPATTGRPLFEHWARLEKNPFDVTGAAIPIPGTLQISSVAGRLNEQSTTAVRDLLSKQVGQRWSEAPPISIRTAGKFCQMLAVPGFDLVNTTDAYHATFAALAESNDLRATSRHFPAFLGLLTVDSDLAADLADGNAGGALREFGITDPVETHVLTEFAGQTVATRNAFLLGPGNWDNCGEQYNYWIQNNDVMVN